MKVLFTILISILIISCNSEVESNTRVRSMNEPNRPISILKELALKNGNIDAYEELETAYLDYAHGDFYEIAKEMADKHNYPRAYYDVYIQILKPTSNPHTTINLDSCSITQRNEAIQYLQKSFEYGFEPAGNEIQQLKKEGIIK